MSIDEYTTVMFWCYIGVFFVSVLAGIAETMRLLFRRVRGFAALSMQKRGERDTSAGPQDAVRKSGSYGDPEQDRKGKKPFRYWRGIIPCAALYSISALFSTSVAYIAYDDIADPNYERYAGWTLREFVLHDIKTFMIWLFIGVLFYLAWKRKWTEKLVTAGCVLLGCVIVSVLLIVLLSAVHQ